MTLSANRSLGQVAAGVPSILQIGVDGGAHIYQGSMVAPQTPTGYGTVGGGVASCGNVLGVATHEVDNSAGSDGDLSCNLAQGVFRMKNSAGSAVTQAYFGQPVYAEDGETVRIATGATYPCAGIFLGFEADGTTPLVGVGALYQALIALRADLASTTINLGASLVGLDDAGNYFDTDNVEAALQQIIADLALTTATHGANMIGYQDSGNKTTAATVDEALDAIFVDGTSTLGTIEIPLGTITDADGDFTKFANAGADGLTITDSKAVCFRTNNAANPPHNLTSFAIPYDADITANMTLKFLVSKTGATNNAGNTTTITVELFNQVDGALHDADADYGGATGAVVPNAAAKTLDVLSLTLLAANLPAAGSKVSMTFHATDGTLDTDDFCIHRIWVEYTRKLRTS